MGGLTAASGPGGSDTAAEAEGAGEAGAPWAAGPQTVDVSLDELQAAKPNPEFWDAEAPAGETSKP